MTKKEILKSAITDYKGVMAFCGVGQTKAYSIMKICKKEYKGTVRYEPKYITTDSLMAYLGTTRERELTLLDIGSKNENLQED